MTGAPGADAAPERSSSPLTREEVERAATAVHEHLSPVPPTAEAST